MTYDEWHEWNINKIKPRILKMLGIEDIRSKEGKMRYFQWKWNNIDPDNSQLILCECGHECTIDDCPCRKFDNGEWEHRSGRAGDEWLCPKCNEVVWKYVRMLN